LNNLAPIILFVYNRPEHTKRTIESLLKNTLAEKSTLYIFSDGPKSAGDEKNVNAVRNYIRALKGFNKFEIIEREKNLGLANSVILGITDIINKYGKAIILEDDIVTSKYFLKYMNEALDFYHDDKRIFSISGYSFPIKIPKDYKYQIFVASRPTSWGWATWNERWNKAIWDSEYYLNMLNRKQINQFVDMYGKDIAPMLLKTLVGKIDSWAVKWIFTHIKYEAHSILPTKSLVKNIGADATGTNFKRRTGKYNVELETELKQYEFRHNLTINRKIHKQIERISRPGILSYLKYRLFGIY
jgi:Glycosyl transferase family 2